MQDTKNFYDVIIVGAGPAGLSAAIYMARAKYKVLVLEKEKVGGQITITSEIVNYPGVEKTSGSRLTQSMKIQAEEFGAEFAIAEVLEMELEEDIKVLHTTRGKYEALGIILAPGANPRKLGFKGEKEFQGRGIAYCATCDGEFFTGREVFVVGGGFAAVEEGIFLTKYARKVTMIVREEDFTCAKTVSDKVKNEEKVTVKFHTEILEAGGENMVSHARFYDNQTKKEWEYKADEEEGFGIFVFAGYVPNTEWIHRIVERDDHGYILTDMNQKTSVDGVYAAGDVCVKNLRQVVTAVSDGAVAATSLEKHVSLIHEKLHIPEFERHTIQVEKNAASPAEEESGAAEGNDRGFLNDAIRNQLKGLFPKFEHKVQIRAVLDDSPLSGEVGNFLGELDGISDKISITKAQADEEMVKSGKLLPSMDLYREDGSFSGISFHGVPGGHEFNSFIIALYNTAGPGQQIDEGVETRLKNLAKDVNIKVFVSLSCTMCPEVVMATQKAASISSNITAEMVDLMHYPKLKDKYKVMSVPCMVVNKEHVYFGKKAITEIVDIIEQA